MEKIILEAYREVAEDNREIGVVPNVRDVELRVLYNIEAKAYNFIYDLSASSIKPEEIIKILERYKMSYSYENRLHNIAQNKVF